MIQQALSFVDPTERDTWVKMGMAIKSERGDGGFDIWNDWSAGADNYTPASAKSVWRSITSGGGVTIGSLYALAKENGWSGEGFSSAPVARRDTQMEDAMLAQRRADAANKAQKQILDAEYRIHPYLASKGFEDALALVLDEHYLLIPMRDYLTGEISSVQSVTPKGEKKFLPGGKAKGSVFINGSGRETYLCEGYATGLSIKAALDYSYRSGRVVVCFSAANMAHVSNHFRGFVIADNDISGIGQKYAEKTRLPWWMPPVTGDANDYHMSHGLPGLAQALREAKNRGNAA